MLALVLGGIAFLVAGHRAEANDPVAPSDHCVCRHNAQQKKELVNYGAYARIQWKKLNLKAGRIGLAPRRKKGRIARNTQAQKSVRMTLGEAAAYRRSSLLTKPVSALI